MIDQGLLVDFLRVYPAQPATAFWRAVEVAAVVRHGLPDGLGLDIGCGDGLLTQVLLQRVGVRSLVGIDSDPEEIEAAKRFGFYQRLHACDSAAIPEETGSFDFALANSVLEHIPDPAPTIAEVSRLLRSGARFVFTVPGPSFHANLSGGGGKGPARAQYLSRLDRRLAHRHYLSEGEWAQLCARHGLILDTCLGYLSPVETRRWELASSLTGGLLYRLRGAKEPPILIQRKLGLRAIQNRWQLPRLAARAIARALLAGVPVAAAGHEDDPAVPASCFLLSGRRG